MVITRFVAVMLLAFGTAHAAPPSLTPVRVEAPVPVPVADVKSPWIAFGLSAATTVVGGYILAVLPTNGEHSDAYKATWATVGLGMMTVGPSMGHVYAGDNKRAALMTGLRALAIAGAALSAPHVDLCVGCWREHGSEPEPDNDVAGAVMAASVLTFIGTSIFELYDAPAAARRANARHREMMFAPMVSGGSYGAVLGGSF